MSEEKPFIPSSGEEKETGTKLDLEEAEGDVAEGRAAILDWILQQNGREGRFFTWSSRRGNGNVFLRVSDQMCQRKADVLGRHLHVIKPSVF